MLHSNISWSVIVLSLVWGEIDFQGEIISHFLLETHLSFVGLWGLVQCLVRECDCECVLVTRGFSFQELDWCEVDQPGCEEGNFFLTLWASEHSISQPLVSFLFSGQ